jgi:glycosyltransferase involved in cell wall biosynthesis
MLSQPTTAPRVSVIIIFYNAARYFVEAIETVVQQSFEDWELLLVDDGSSDESTKIARDYAARSPGRIRYLEHPGHSNRGMSATRNLGIRHARGELIAFNDADDVWARTKLAEQVAIMDAHPEVGMVCGTVRYWKAWAGGTDVITPTGHALDRVVAPPEAALQLYPLGRADAPCPSDMMLRASVIVEVGGFEESFRGFYEDQVFLAKVYLATPVWFSSSVWLDYRQHPDSCVAVTARDGSYHKVRAYFMRWLWSYVDARPAPWKLRLTVYRERWIAEIASAPTGLLMHLRKLKPRTRLKSAWSRLVGLVGGRNLV